MKERIRDKGRLEHILQAIDNAIEFTKDVTFEDFMKDRKLCFAVVKNRVHSYYHISEERVWKIIQKDLLPLQEQIQLLHHNEIVNNSNTGN